MTVITLYRCDVCSKDHFTEEDARRCESRGRKAPMPVGLLWVNINDSWAKALETCLPVGHGLVSQSFVSRERTGGDVIERSWISEDANFAGCPSFIRTWEDMPCFQNLIVHLILRSITPFCFTQDRQIVPVVNVASPGWVLRMRLLVQHKMAKEVSCP